MFYIYSPLPLIFLDKIVLVILYYIIYFTNVRKETLGNFSTEVRYFKGGLSPFKQVGFIYFNESLLKIMNNAFYPFLKTFFALKTFKFLC